MPIVWLVLAAINGAIGIAAGALAVHGPALPHLDYIEIAARYQLYHALGYLGLAALALLKPGWRLAIPGCLWFVGCLGFCGGLYRLGVGHSDGDIVWGGQLVPFGGGAFILGWLSLMILPLWLKRIK